MPMHGLRGTDHIGLTVPDLEQAIEFFTEILGFSLFYRMGPFVDESGTWFVDELGLNARATIPQMAMLKCGVGANLELVEYDAPRQRREPPMMSDGGGHHVAFYVDDIHAAVAELRDRGITILGSVKPGNGPESGEATGWVFFMTPWGLPLEFVSYPTGRAYETAAETKLWDPSSPLG